MKMLSILTLVVCYLFLTEIQGFKWEEFQRQDFRRQEFRRHEFLRQQVLRQEFLRQKWGYFFSSLDVDHDGSLTLNDVEKTLQNFPMIENVSEEEAAAADIKLANFWNKYILQSRDVITRIKFIDETEQRYVNDMQGFKQNVKEELQEMIDFTDVEHDGKMSLDNFIKIFKVFGFDDENILKTAFDMYEKHDGTVLIKDIIDDWVLFLSNSDQKIPDVVLQMYRSGL